MTEEDSSFAVGWEKEESWWCAYRCPCWCVNVDNALHIRPGRVDGWVQSKASLVHTQVSASTINYITLDIDFNLAMKRINFISESRLPKIQFNSASPSWSSKTVFLSVFYLNKCQNVHNKAAGRCPGPQLEMKSAEWDIRNSWIWHKSLHVRS